MAICWNDARERSVAVFATLHLGIEPALLGLLTESGAMPPVAAGWVVGAGQIGMSAGALLSWRMAAAVRRPAAVAAALLGTGAGIGLAIASDLGSVLLLRLLLGGAMGLLLARATAAAARARAQRAIGFIMLGQQLLAAIVMIALPLVAARWSVGTALVALAAVPLVAGLLVRFEADRPASSSLSPLEVADERAVRLRCANLMAMVLLIAATLMVWSYIGAVGMLAGVSSHVGNVAIALASLASVPAALLASLSARRQMPGITALGCGFATLSPLLLPQGSGLAGYVVAMILFNAGSTFAVICFSAWAMEDFVDGRGRRLVVLVQCTATAGGAPLGAIAVAFAGLPALTALVALCVVAAALAPLVARYRPAAVAVVPVRVTG